MTNTPAAPGALGRAYMSGYADGARDAEVIAPTLPPASILHDQVAGMMHRQGISLTKAPRSIPNDLLYPSWPQPSVPESSIIAELRRRAETAETALADVRHQRDVAVTRLADMVEQVGRDAAPGWDDFEPMIDTDGEPVLVADGSLAGTYRMMTGESAGGFEVRVRFTPGERTRIGTGYAYTIRLPFGPDGTP